MSRTNSFHDDDEWHDEIELLNLKSVKSLIRPNKTHHSTPVSVPGYKGKDSTQKYVPITFEIFIHFFNGFGIKLFHVQ